MNHCSNKSCYMYNIFYFRNLKEEWLILGDLPDLLSSIIYFRNNLFLQRRVIAYK